MWAMVVKEFRQLRRDHRTLAMMIVLPVLILVVFGYAASFKVSQISTVVVGPDAGSVARALPAPFQVERVIVSGDRSTVVLWLRDSEAVVGVVAVPGRTTMVMDGTQLFSVQTAEATLARLERGGSSMAGRLRLQILFDPGLTTSWVMVPGLAGLILVFIGTLITSLGVVRERQGGTLEQLAVMPLRPWDVILGKIVPYFVVARSTSW